MIGKLRNRIHELPQRPVSVVTQLRFLNYRGADPRRTEGVRFPHHLLNQDQRQAGCLEGPVRQFISGTLIRCRHCHTCDDAFPETLRYLDEFSRFIIRSRPLATISTARHPVLGCWADDPQPMPDALDNDFSIERCWGGQISADRARPDQRDRRGAVHQLSPIVRTEPEPAPETPAVPRIQAA